MEDQRAPPEAVTVGMASLVAWGVPSPGFTVMEVRFEREITRPSVTEEPRKEWPPPQTARGMWCVLVN